MNLFKFVTIISILIGSFQVSAQLASSQKNYEVVVIGGGISGLATVEMLARKGITNVIVLEQSERVGGKMWTERSLQAQKGPYYERGAELVNTTDVELIELIRNLGLGLTERRFKNESRGEVFYFRDRHVDSKGNLIEGDFKPFSYEQLVEKMHEFSEDREVLEKLFQMQELRTHASGREKSQVMNSLRSTTAMSQVFEGVYTKSFLEALMKSEFGVSLTQVNSEVLLDYVRISKNYDRSGQVTYGVEIIPEADEKFRVTGGTDGIISKLENRYSSKIKKATKVESVEQITDNQFKIKMTTSGSALTEITARHVVFAVPAYDLAKMNINIPEVSPRKLQEAASLPFAENAKIFLVFKNKFWDQSALGRDNAFTGVGVLEGGVQFWDTTENQKSKEGVITLYPGEWPTDKKQQQVKLNEILEQLKKVPGLESLDQHLKSVDMQVWQKSYAGVFNAAYAKSPRLFAETLRSNVYFVGADKDNNLKGEISASYGYMNGAVRTSIRAANKISTKNINQNSDVVFTLPVSKPKVPVKNSCRSMFLSAG